MARLLATAGWAEHPDGAVCVLLLPILLLVIVALVVLGSRLANWAGDRSSGGIAAHTDSRAPRTRWQVTLGAALWFVFGFSAWLGLVLAATQPAVICSWALLAVFYVGRRDWRAVFLHGVGPLAGLAFLLVLPLGALAFGVYPAEMSEMTSRDLMGVLLAMLAYTGWLSGLVSFPASMLMAMAR